MFDFVLSVTDREPATEEEIADREWEDQVRAEEFNEALREVEQRG